MKKIIFFFSMIFAVALAYASPPPNETPLFVIEPVADVIVQDAIISVQLSVISVPEVAFELIYSVPSGYLMNSNPVAIWSLERLLSLCAILNISFSAGIKQIPFFDSERPQTLHARLANSVHKQTFQLNKQNSN